MVGEAGRHGRRALVPLPGRAGSGEQAEAVVGSAEVVGGPDQPPAGGKGRLGAGDRPTSSREWREVSAEGGVEAFDGGGVDDGAGGRGRQDRLDAVQGATKDPAGDADDPSFGRMLDDLSELEPVRQDQAWTPGSPGGDRLAEDRPEGGDVAGQTPSFLGAS